MNDPLRRATGQSLADFSASHWGTTPLLRRGSASRDSFVDLFSISAVDDVLSQRGLRTPFLRMSRDGETLPAARFTRGGGAGAEIADQVADDKVLAEFAAGATIVLQALHRTWPPLRDFAAALAAQLGHPVQINAYVTPPQNAGFAAHYDVHDVFVMQFAGRKRWRVHEPVLASPLRDQPWTQRRAAVAARCAEPPMLDVVLECGDTLYLPRGYVHAATSLGEIAGHLTVGVHPVTRRTIVDEVFSALATDVELRRSLPIGIDLADPNALDREFAATIDALRGALERVDRATIARGIGRHLAAAVRPASLRPLEQFATAAALSAERHVRLRHGLDVTTRVDGADVVVETADAEVRFPAAAARAARVATSGDDVAAVDLPGLELDESVTLLARLLRDGIVVPA